MAPAAPETTRMIQDHPSTPDDADGDSLEPMNQFRSAMADMEDDGRADIGIQGPLEEEPPILFERSISTTNAAAALASLKNHCAPEGRAGFLHRTKEQIVLDPHQTGLPAKFTECDEDGIPIITLAALNGPTFPLPPPPSKRHTSQGRDPPPSTYSLIEDPERIPPVPESIGRMPYIVPPLLPLLQLPWYNTLTAGQSAGIGSDEAGREWEETTRRRSRMSSVRTTAAASGPRQASTVPPQLNFPRASASRHSQSPTNGDQARGVDSGMAYDAARLPRPHSWIHSPHPPPTNTNAPPTQNESWNSRLSSSEDDRTAEVLTKVRSLTLDTSQSSLPSSLSPSFTPPTSGSPGSSNPSIQSSPATSAYSPVSSQLPPPMATTSIQFHVDESISREPDPPPVPGQQGASMPQHMPEVANPGGVHFEHAFKSSPTGPAQTNAQAQTASQRLPGFSHKYRDHGQITLFVAPQLAAAPAAEMASTSSKPAPETKPKPKPRSKPGPVSSTSRKAGTRVACPFEWCETTFRSNYELNRHLKTATKHVEKAQGDQTEKVFCELCGTDLSRGDARLRHEERKACGKRRVRRKPVHPMAKAAGGVSAGGPV